MVLWRRHLGLSTCFGRLQRHLLQLSMISAVQHGMASSVGPVEDDDGLEHLQVALERLDQGMKMDSEGFADLLRRCGKEAALSEGRQVHAHIVRSGYDGERFLENLLMEMYGKCGSLEDARACFGRIYCPNHYSWTIMISAYAQNGHMQEALHLFSLMALNGVKANAITFIVAIDACSKLGSLTYGKKLHATIVLSGFLLSSVRVGNALINMYGKCRNLEDARNVFDMMPGKDVISWNSMIVAYAQNGHGREALELYRRMDLKPDRVTYVGVVDACGSIADLEQGRLIHASIASSGIKSDIVLDNTILKMYGKCKSLEEARAMFDRMSCSNLISWNVMISAYAQNGHGNQALGMFQKMDLEGLQADSVSFISVLDVCANLKALPQGKAIHDSITGCELPTNVSLDNAILNLYGRCGCPSDAKRVFDRMLIRDVVSWTAMISAFVESGDYKGGLALYRRMSLEGGHPTEVTFMTVLDACANLGALSDGKAIHACIPSVETADIILGNTLVNMYSKCGELAAARAVFDEIHQKNLFSWTIMIGACTQHGHNREAIRLFHQMVAEDIEPDNITFSIVLHACANLGSLTEGKAIHRKIIDCQLEPDLIMDNTLMNMYGRCGSLADARSVFEKMPTRNSISWNAMITTYAQQEDFKEALALFKRMELENVKPDRVTFVVALDCCAGKASLEQGKAIHASAAAHGFDSDIVIGNTLVNMYGKCGLLDVARRVFDKMPQRDVVTWTTMIAAYAYSGHGMEALKLFRLMQQDYTEPNEVTFIGVLFACSHVGLLREARGYLLSLRGDYSLEATPEHYACMIDLLGRSGRLDEAEDLVDNMPLQPDNVILTTLLGACTTHGDLKRGIRAAKYVFELDLKDQTPYVLLSNIYSAAGMADGVKRVKKALGQADDETGPEVLQDKLPSSLTQAV